LPLHFQQFFIGRRSWNWPSRLNQFKTPIALGRRARILLFLFRFDGRNPAIVNALQIDCKNFESNFTDIPYFEFGSGSGKWCNECLLFSLNETTGNAFPVVSDEQRKIVIYDINLRSFSAFELPAFCFRIKTICVVQRGEERMMQKLRQIFARNGEWIAVEKAIENFQFIFRAQ